MKKLLFTLILSSNVAMAASTGTLVLEGVVPTSYNLVVTASGNTNLNITGGETNKTVANVREISNSPNGYKIVARSANGGKLQSASDFTTYTLSYDGATAVSLTTANTTVKTVSSQTSVVDLTNTVRVNVTAKSSALAGTYTDTVTFEIQAP